MQRAVLAVGAGLIASFAAWGQSATPQANGIEAIAVADSRAGTSSSRSRCASRSPIHLQGFTINNPPRIAFDFPDTDNALGKTTQEVGDGELRNMNIVQAAGRTRLVMNLAKPVGYDTKIDGKMVLITLQTSAAEHARSPQ